MQKSISSKETTLGFLASGITLVVLTVLSSQAGEPVDDSALKKRFESELSALLVGKELGNGEEIRKQLADASGSHAGRKTPILFENVANKEPANSLFERLEKSTLLLGSLYKCGRCDKWHASTAGGVVLDSKNRIAVTNHHVIDNKEAAQFGAMSREGVLFPIEKILAASRKNDLALVRLGGDKSLPPALPLAAKPARVSETIHIVSHPDGHYFSYTRGIVSRYYLQGRSRSERMQVTADYARGSSGCGVFDSQGYLVGLVASTNSIYYKETKDKETDLQMVIKSCVPVEKIHELLKQ